MSKRIYIIVALILVFTLSFSILAFAEPDDETTPPETQPEVTEALPDPQPEQPAENPQPEQPAENPQPAQTQAPQPRRSNNSLLSALEVVGKTEDGQDYPVALEPAFNPGTRTYNLTVPFNVVRLDIRAAVQDGRARITIPSGYLTLDVGQNRSFVTVTAEDGSTRRYQINTVRLEEEITEESTTEPVTEPSTEPTTAEPETTEVVATTQEVHVKKGINTFTKLGIVFAVCGVILFIISVAMISKKKKPETED